VFFAGKGGVGKTTCSAAYALSRQPRRVLLVSTDPAHSLGDALGARLSSKPRKVARALDAVELDAPRAFARWLKEHRRPLGDVIEHGTWLDREDVDALLDLSIPGVDELVGIIEIGRFAARGGRRGSEGRRQGGRRGGRGERRGHAYDLIVVDTAPTGHTLRLLSAPETVAAVADVLDALQEPHRIIRDQLARVGRSEASDQLISLLAAQARDTSALLRDSDSTAFHWVTLPEDLASAETADGIAALEAGAMRVSEIVVNRVLPDDGPCPLCDPRRADQHRVIADLRRGLGRGRRVSIVPASVDEPRGVKALASLARNHAPGSVAQAFRAADRRVGSPEGLGYDHVQTRQPGDQFADIAQGASLLFFGGKGGVGKTTVSAATALWLAQADPERRVLLLSTDPAHSLGDVFQARIGDTARAIPRAPANLLVRELDAARALAVRRTAFEAALDEIASAVGAGAVAASGGASELMTLAPPGIDELFGVLSVVDARTDFDVILVDTAPTGHALRLLEMPDAAREWMQVLLRVLLKYKTLVRPGQLAAELVALSKAIRELQTLLRDPAQTRFIVVTRAAEVPRLETVRLIAQLRRLHLATPALVVNARTLVPGQCGWCRATAAAERRELDALRRACGRRCAMIDTPLVAPPPRGVRQLNEWAATWLQPKAPTSTPSLPRTRARA
jgi:arsenite-transporting ATPase